MRKIPYYFLNVSLFSVLSIFPANSANISNYFIVNGSTSMTLMTTEGLFNVLESILFSFLSIIVILLLIILIVFVILWIHRSDEVSILPFMIPECDGNIVSRVALSNMLAFELHRIIRMSKDWDEGGIVTEMPSFHNTVSLRTESISGLPDLGSVGTSQISISIRELLTTLKILYPWRKSGTIKGCLQKFGSILCLVVYMEQGKKEKEIRSSVVVYSWKAFRDISKVDCEMSSVSDINRFKGDTNHDKLILDIVKELSYKIIYDLSDKNTRNDVGPGKGISAKNWSSFMNYMEALNGYKKYKITGDINYLNHSLNSCLDALKLDKGYKYPLNLIYYLGIDFYNEAKYDISLEMFKKVIVNGKCPLSYIGLTSSLIRLNRYNEALWSCDRAIGLDYPKDIESNLKKNLLVNKGQALYSLGKYDEALKSFDAAIQLDPTDPYPRFQKAIVFSYYLGKYKEALRTLNKAIQLDENWLDPCYLKGFILSYYLGRYNDSLRLLKAVIEFNPKFAPAWVELGLVKYYKCYYDDSIKCYDEAIILAPRCFMWVD